MDIKENYYFKSKGKVIASRGNGNFLVKAEDMETPVSCTLASGIKRNNIRILEGDDVIVEISTHDPSKGRITYRQR